MFDNNLDFLLFALFSIPTLSGVATKRRLLPFSPINCQCMLSSSFTHIIYSLSRNPSISYNMSSSTFSPFHVHSHHFVSHDLLPLIFSVTVNFQTSLYNSTWLLGRNVENMAYYGLKGKVKGPKSNQLWLEDLWK